MQPFRYSLVIVLSLLTLASFSQRKKDGAKIKFGDVKPADFQPTVYSIDSNANAIILGEIGDVKYEGGNRGWFNVVYNCIRRIRLINKNGFDDATVQIPIRFGGGGEEELLSNFEAATYNIENGQVVTTKVDKSSLFKDKYSKYETVRKFTFPNIKEGSIIEYKYTISSPFFRYLRPWQFQGYLPRLWSEYQVTIPSDILDFVVTRKGYLPFTIDTVTEDKESYNILIPGDASQASEVVTIPSNTLTAHWAVKDAPPLKDESYVTSLDNYRRGVNFQLRRIKLPSRTIDNMGNWNQFVDELTKADNFGVPLSDKNGWLGDELKKITAGASNDLDKAHKIYNYIRDNFTCSSDDGFLTTKPLKKVFQDKNGTVGDINLLLIAALKNIGLDATPALLSTRDNGKASEMYPIIDQYNYVICDLKINDADYTLDATNKWAGFGKLDEELYNGSARLIAPLPALVPLVSDSLKETRVTTVFMMNDEDGKGLSASYSCRLGEHQGIDFRRKIKKVSAEEFFKAQKKALNFETTLSETEIDSLDQPDEPVTIKYSFTIKPGDEDIIYLNPLLTETLKDNPFKSAERLFPVEMSHCTDETFILNMEVPKGYKVDELPKSARVKLNEDDGMFEYIIASGGGRIQLRCRVQIKKATFMPDDYQTLRDFYAFIVKKEAEQIVLKKI